MPNRTCWYENGLGLRICRQKPWVQLDGIDPHDLAEFPTLGFQRIVTAESFNWKMPENG